MLPPKSVAHSKSSLLARPKALVLAFAAGVDHATRVVSELGIGAFAWPCVIGLGLGVGLLGIAEPRFVQAMQKRRATAEFMRPALTAIAVAALATAVVALVVAALKRRRDPSRSLRIEYARALARGAFLAGLPLLLALRQPLEATRDWLTLGFAVTASALLGYSAYHFAGERRSPPRPSLPARLRFWLPLVVATIATALFLGRLAVSHHLGFQTGRELGFAVSRLGESSEGRLLACSLCAAAGEPRHFEPLLLLFAPLFHFEPYAETLLVLQAAWLASTAIPLALLGAKTTGSSTIGVAVAIAFLVHPAVQGQALAGFHSLSLAVPLFAWLLFCLEHGAVRGYWAFAIALLLVREDVGIALAGVGVTALFSRTPARARLGLLTLGLALAYLVLVPLFRGPSPLAPLASVLADTAPASKGRGKLDYPGIHGQGPLLFLSRALSLEKVDLAAKLLAPLFLMPLFARGRWLLAYGAALILFAKLPGTGSYDSELLSLVLPFLFVLTLGALAAIVERGRVLPLVSGRRLALAAALSILFATTLASAKFGALVPNESFRIGKDRLVRKVDPKDARRDAFLRRVARALPKGARVAAANPLLPHLGSSSHLLPLSARGTADFVVVSTKSREVMKVVGAEESGAHLVRSDAFEDLRVYRTAYSSAPPSSKQLVDE